MHARLRLVATAETKRVAARVRAESRKAKEVHRRLRTTAEVPLNKPITHDIDGRTHQDAGEAVGAGALGGVAQVFAEGNAYHHASQSASKQSFSGDQPSTARPAAESVTSHSKSRTSSSSSRGDAARAPPLSPLTTFVDVKEASKAPVRHIDELKFERRRIPRSRSPSRATVLTDEDSRAQLSASSGTIASFMAAAKSTGISSRPNTPRGRALSIRREQSQADAFAPASTSSLSKTDFGRHLASRSPSRARMRITGFGQDEEVLIDKSDGSPHAAIEGQPSEQRAVESQEPSLHVSRAGDEARRLSLVGEEESADAARCSASSGRSPAAPSSSSAPFREQEVASLASADGLEHQSAQALELEASSGDGASDSEDSLEIAQWELVPMDSIIPEPGRASAEENEWIESMLGREQEEWVVEWFRKYV